MCTLFVRHNCSWVFVCFSTGGGVADGFCVVMMPGLLGHHAQAQARPSARCDGVGLGGGKADRAAHALASARPSGDVAVSFCLFLFLCSFPLVSFRFSYSSANE